MQHFFLRHLAVAWTVDYLDRPVREFRDGTTILLSTVTPIKKQDGVLFCIRTNAMLLPNLARQI
jgi:hypothetical protein